MTHKKTPNSKETIRKFNKFRLWSLTAAESFDSWRIIPRIILIAYAALVLNMYVWYKSIPTYVQEKCDAAVVQIFIQNKSTIEDAQKAACSVQGLVGGPTPAQTALVTTIIGLSSLVFGFYTGTGRKWDNGLPPDVTGGMVIVDQPQMPIQPPCAPLPSAPPMPVGPAPICDPNAPPVFNPNVAPPGTVG